MCIQCNTERDIPVPLAAMPQCPHSSAYAIFRQSPSLCTSHTASVCALVLPDCTCAVLLNVGGKSREEWIGNSRGPNFVCWSNLILCGLIAFMVLLVSGAMFESGIIFYDKQ